MHSQRYRATLTLALVLWTCLGSSVGWPLTENSSAVPARKFLKSRLVFWEGGDERGERRERMNRWFRGSWPVSVNTRMTMTGSVGLWPVFVSFHCFWIIGCRSAVTFTASRTCSNILQYSAMFCNTLQYPVIFYTILQHFRIPCYIIQHYISFLQYFTPYWIILEYDTEFCGILYNFMKLYKILHDAIIISHYFRIFNIKRYLTFSRNSTPFLYTL